MGVLPKLQEFGKRVITPLQLNVSHPTTPNFLDPPPITNLLTSQNVTVDGEVNQAIHHVGAKINVDTSTSADDEKKKNSTGIGRFYSTTATVRENYASWFGHRYGWRNLLSRWCIESEISR